MRTQRTNMNGEERTDEGAREAERASLDSQSAHPEQSEVQQLQMELVRMRTQLDQKGMEVKAELTAAQNSAKAAKDLLTALERELRTVRLQAELEKLREMESLRREFDQERRQLREDRERDVSQYKKWEVDRTRKRDRLRKRVDQLMQQLEKAGEGLYVSTKDQPVEKGSLSPQSHREMFLNW